MMSWASTNLHKVSRLMLTDNTQNWPQEFAS